MKSIAEMATYDNYTDGNFLLETKIKKSRFLFYNNRQAKVNTIALKG